MSQETIKKPIDHRKKIRQIESRFEVYRTILAILFAVVLVFAVIFFTSKTPFKAIQILLIGPFTNARQFGNVLLLMIPLTFTGLAITIVFKTKRFNLAADGAFFLGMMIATMIGLTSKFPPIVTVILALLGGLLGGAILGFIPAILNKIAKTSELVISLMQNYVVGYFVLYLFINVFRNPTSSALETYAFPKGVNLGSVMKFGRVNIHWGIVIALLLVIITYLVIYRTKVGYALRTTGLNEKFAKYTGLNTQAIIIVTQIIGTAIAGLGGAVEILGRYSTFKFHVSPGFGFDGILLATLAKGNPAYIPLSAFFLAYIRVGADMVNLQTDVPAEIIFLVQATIILLISAKSFLKNWKQRSIVKSSINTPAVKGEN